MEFKNLEKADRARVIGLSVVILICLLLGIFVPIFFPGTKFDMVITNSIGKFFNLVSFFKNQYVTILESISIIIFLWIIYKILVVLIRIFIKRSKKAETIGNLMLSSIKYITVTVAIFMLLKAWGVPTPTLLASAGIIGLAISFGAQSLIEDIFAGLFIIFEKQFSVGDVIQIDDFRGVVKLIGLRITKFEDVYGDIKIINNSDIRGAINSSNILSKAICDVSISYNEDIEIFEKLMREQLKTIKDKVSTIKKGPFYEGIEEFGDSSITIRIVAWTREIDRLHTIRELNKQIKLLFDKNNIDIPFPQLVIHNKEK